MLSKQKTLYFAFTATLTTKIPPIPYRNAKLLWHCLMMFIGVFTPYIYDVYDFTAMFAYSVDLGSAELDVGKQQPNICKVPPIRTRLFFLSAQVVA